MQLILTALIVSFGSISHVQSSEQMGKKLVTNDAQDGNKIQQNFHHFFDSIKKNDMRKTRTYRDLLEQEAEEEQRAFHTMKEDLRFARQKSVRKQKNTYPTDGGNTGQKMHFSKRETSNSNGRPVDVSPSSPSNQPEGEEATVKDLPLVGEDFQSIRKNNKIYVDKTQFLAKLLDHFFYSEKRHYILTRPPRFGKTTFLEMVASFFRGEKHLFEGTSIYQRGNTEEKNGTWIEYPVIDLNFGKMLDDFVASSEPRTFRFFFRQQMQNIAAKYNVPAEGTFFLLVRALAQKFNLPVVALGDEYDRPMDYAVHVMKNMTVAEHMQRVAKSFIYNILEEGSKIRFAFIVGVLKLDVDEESIRQFRDITHHREFASITGFSHQEIDTYFQPFVRKFAENKARTPADIMNEIIKRYDGYRFACDDNQTRVFNPVSVVESLRKEDLTGHHYCSNHSLERIVHAFIKQNLTVESFENCFIPREVLFNANSRSYPIQQSVIPISVYMLLYGYLTITEYDAIEDKATLDYANDEVKRAVASRLETEKKEWNPPNETLESYESSC